MSVKYHLCMENALATLATGLAGLAASGVMAALAAARVRRGRPYLASGLLVAIATINVWNRISVSTRNEPPLKV